MRQVAMGLECDLRRRNYNVSVTLEERPVIDGRWRYRWASTYHMTILHGRQQTVIRFFNMFRPNSEAHGLPEILQTYPVDVLIFDHGLHFLKHEKGEFLEDSLPALQLLGEKVPLLIWRETTSQHYDNPGGHFDREGLDGETSCVNVPLSEQTNQPAAVDWMQELVVQQMNWTMIDASAPNFVSTPRSSGQQELVMIPFRRFTSYLWDLHPGFPDCSHFCSTPFVWVPIWRSLRLAIDRGLWTGQLQAFI
jgi:hypothetical protein